MIDLSDAELSNAEMTYLVSNTPSFIVRKLKADPAVQKLGSGFSNTDLEVQFRKIVSKKPGTLKEVVLPFVVAAALDLKSAYRELNQISRLNTAEFPYLKDYIMLLLAAGKSNATISMGVRPPSVKVDVTPSKTVTSPNSQSIILNLEQTK